MKKINDITLKIEPDDNPDVSYLGEIARNQKYRHENEAWIPVDPDNPSGDWYSPMNHLPHKDSNWAHVDQKTKDEVIARYGSLRKADIAYAYQDLERLQKFNAGSWWMEIITLRASIAVSDDGEHWAYDEVVCSLGGVESDGGEDYKHTIVKDLKSELAHELLVWGFSKEKINNAFSEMKTT